MNTADMQQRYAELLVRFGINLQPGQGLFITAEPVAREFTRLLVDEAYRAGAKYVHVAVDDPHHRLARLKYGNQEFVEYVPDYDVARINQYIDETWARIGLTSEEFPHLLDEIDPALVARAQAARSAKLRRYSDAVVSAKFQWVLAAVPNPSWARRVFPDLPVDDGVAKLWDLVLQSVRADQPDPVAAWAAHDKRLKTVSAALAAQQVTALHFHDPAPADDGAPSTDLRIGLTPQSKWVSAAFVTPAGIPFVANMPSEELFTSPHRLLTQGYVRTSKPLFPLGREVRDAWFRFENGECVEARAKHGDDVLQQFLTLPGARHLGEVALVDVRSPINQSGAVFYDILFDENAACHIAFGNAIISAVEGAAAMDDTERLELGLNKSDVHSDFMIGSATMNVDGLRADGGRVPVMRNGQFVAALGG